MGRVIKVPGMGRAGLSLEKAASMVIVVEE